MAGSHLGVGGKSQGIRMKGLKRGQAHMGEPGRKTCAAHKHDGRFQQEAMWTVGGRLVQSKQVWSGWHARAASPREGSVGGSGVLSHQALGHHRPLRKPSTLRNLHQGLKCASNNRKLIVTLFPRCFRKCFFFFMKFRSFKNLRSTMLEVQRGHNQSTCKKKKKKKTKYL